MTTVPVLLADGEKVSTRQIAETHLPHPGVSEYFRRSTLLIGSRGVGKTFLLRHRKQTSHRGAIYVNLVEALPSIARDAGIGGRSLIFSADQANRIRAKTAALIASRAIELCISEVDSDISLSLGIMDPLLPRSLRATGSATLAAAKELRFAISSFPLPSWHPRDLTHVLIDVLGDLANKYPHNLTIFFDRAEDVSIPSLNVLMQLLDQSVRPLVVIAARPGVAQLLPRHHDPTFIPGDHYDIIHVGLRPYEDPWQTFVEGATRNYLVANEIAAPDDVDLRWTCRMSRDSIRQAVNFAQIAISTISSVESDERRLQMYAHRERLLRAVRQLLLPEHSDIRNVIDYVQHHPDLAEHLSDGIQLCVLLRIVGQAAQLSILAERDQLEDFLLRAMRGSALFYPPGTEWHPQELPDSFELAPLLAWNGKNPKWIT